MFSSDIVFRSGIGEDLDLDGFVVVVSNYVVCSFRYSAETAKPIYVPPKHLNKYSPLNTSLLQLQQINPISTQAKGKNRKQVTRTQSVPASERHHRHPLKRTTSNTELTETPDIHHEENHMKISPPQQVRVL